MPITIIPLTAEQKSFIEENYKTMSRPKMAKKLGLRDYRIDRYMSEKNLIRRTTTKKPKAAVRPGYYDERVFRAVMGFNGGW